jgi:hypothetical protein
MASARSIQRAASVSPVNNVIKSAHTIHCTVLLFITNSKSKHHDFVLFHDPKPRVTVWWVPKRGLRFVLSRNPHYCEFRGPVSLVRHRGDR